MSRRSGRYPAELKERAVRMVFDYQHEYPSQWKAICSIGEQLGCIMSRCGFGFGGRRLMLGSGRGSRLMNGPGSRSSSVRTVSYGGPMRFSSLRRFSSRPSSTVEPGSDRLHRRSPGLFRGRADLQSVAVRPAHLLCS